MIKVAAFIIFDDGDSAKGLPLKKYKIEGDFEFETEDVLNNFITVLFGTFLEVCYSKPEIHPIFRTEVTK